MRLKSHRHGPCALLSRSRNNFLQHQRVRPVHAIKITDADQRGAKIAWNLVEFMKNLHSQGFQ
jgi:hypothetical protein